MLRKIIIGITALSISLAPALAAQVQPAPTIAGANRSAKDVSDISFRRWLLGLAAVVALFLAAEFAFDEEPVSP